MNIIKKIDVIIKQLVSVILDIILFLTIANILALLSLMLSRLDLNPLGGKHLWVIGCTLILYTVYKVKRRILGIGGGI